MWDPIGGKLISRNFFFLLSFHIIIIFSLFFQKAIQCERKGEREREREIHLHLNTNQSSIFVLVCDDGEEGVESR